MSKNVEKELRINDAKKRGRNKKIAIVGGIICVVAIIVGVVVATRPKIVTTQTDINGDLRISLDTIGEGLNFIDFGGKEELVLLRDSEGIIKTAFDTCQSCYENGEVHYSLNGETLTCSSCGNTMSVHEFGTNVWGGCMPVSIPVDFRKDTETEVVIPAEILEYSADMFAHWDMNEYGVSLGDYGTENAHTH